MKPLSIVIPAYKARFLRATLESISKQDNQEFTVYIGDDASPHDLGSIIGEYKDLFDIVYYRFEENMGGKDLVGHWERCIELTQEPLIWLFSDDDLMPSDAVTRILQASQEYGIDKFMFRFPLVVVDEFGELKHQNPPLESGSISGYEFLLDKLYGRISSAACEYVFSRDVWQQNRFIRFPLAWCSDDATWTKFGDYVGGIHALPGNPVCWRNADGENISNSTCFNQQKIKSTQLFLEWIRVNYRSHLKDKKLHAALQSYLCSCLQQSLRGEYDMTDLVRLCSTLYKLTPKIALKLFCHYFNKVK